MVPVRAGPPLRPTEKATVPLAVPVLLVVSQLGALLTAVHVQPDPVSTVTLKLELPATADIVVLVEEREYVGRACVTVYD